MSNFEWEPQYIQHEGISYQVLLDYIRDRVEFGGRKAIAFPCQYNGSSCYEVRTKRPLGDHHLNDIRTTKYENELQGIVDSPRTQYEEVYHRPSNPVRDCQPPPPPPPRSYYTHSPVGMKPIQMHVHVHGNTMHNISFQPGYPREYPSEGYYYRPPYSPSTQYYPSSPSTRSYTTALTKSTRSPSRCPTYTSQSISTI